MSAGVLTTARPNSSKPKVNNLRTVRLLPSVSWYLGRAFAVQIGRLHADALSVVNSIREACYTAPVTMLGAQGARESKHV